MIPMYNNMYITIVKGVFTNQTIYSDSINGNSSITILRSIYTTAVLNIYIYT